MSETYFKLKKQLEQLGYSKHLPVDAVPLVECLTADLLQTTRSLQHYMEIAQDAIHQRDDLMLQAEPYKRDNAKLIKENNNLNKQLLNLKEEHVKVLKETGRRIKALSDEIVSKEETISRLKQQCRDLGLRGLCAGTLSSRNKTKNTEAKETVRNECNCATRDNVALENSVIELKKEVQNMKECNARYSDEIVLLQNQVENRDDEIIRLSMLLEGGRPLAAVIKDCSDKDVSPKIAAIYQEFKGLEAENANLMKELDQSIEKQHEAMLRALNLADRNKLLEEELSKLDKLALTVEDECNNQLKTKYSENIYLREQVNDLLVHNNKLKVELAERRSDSIEKLEKNVNEIQEIKEYLNNALKEKQEFSNQVETLQSLNKSLEEKLTSALSQVTKIRSDSNQEMVSRLATKDDLKNLMEREIKEYESYSLPWQRKMADALENFNKNVSDLQQGNNKSSDNEFVYELYRKICEYERKILELENENDRLKAKEHNTHSVRHRNFEEKIAQFRAENAELTKENMMLSSTLGQLKRASCSTDEFQLEKSKSTINKLNNDIDQLIYKNNSLQNEKKDYLSRYKESIELTDLLKRDLILKQSQLEQLQEENCGYRMTSRSGRASVDHLRDECNFLREQMLKMQSEMIKEKTVTSQLKNLQVETERSTSEMQNDLLLVQKQLSLSKDSYLTLENKCKDLQSEILSLRIEKTKLIDNMRHLDHERDTVVMETDRKTESISLLEQKLNSKTYTIEKLENEIAQLKQTNVLNNISEHKLRDTEAKIHFLNGEVERLAQLNENAIIENKRLQSNLANADSALKVTKLEYDKSRKDADGLRLQLQHYVAEVKRIEDLLSHKEAERTDMLENFASLSVEANVLENTNHSLENESASKSLQLQTYISKVEELEQKLSDKENTIDSQSARIASLTCRASAMENEIKLITEERTVLEKNNCYLKELCHKLESEKRSMGHGIETTDSELQLYENKIKSLHETKTKLELENSQIKTNVQSVESLLSTARREVIELKLALQDATSETKILKEQINKLNAEVIRKQELPLSEADPIASAVEMEETLHAITQELAQDELEEELRESRVLQRRSMIYLHGSTI